LGRWYASKGAILVVRSDHGEPGNNGNSPVQRVQAAVPLTELPNPSRGSSDMCRGQKNAANHESDCKPSPCIYLDVGGPGRTGARSGPSVAGPLRQLRVIKASCDGASRREIDRPENSHDLNGFQVTKAFVISSGARDGSSLLLSSWLSGAGDGSLSPISGRACGRRIFAFVDLLHDW